MTDERFLDEPKPPRKGETVRQYLRRCRKACPHLEWRVRRLTYGYGPRVIENRKPRLNPGLAATYWAHWLTWEGGDAP